MYPAQTYLNQNKFAFLCWEEAEMKLAGSWCHQHHLYVLKWITDKGFALLQEKGPNVFAFKYRIKWNAYSQCGTSFWLPVWRRRAEKSRLYPPKLSLLPPSFFFICYWSKWGQLLEISVEPWMPQWWLSLRLMHLIYLFGISETLFSSQLGVPGPVSCSMMRYILAVSTLACLVGLWLSHGRNRVGPVFLGPSPSSISGH